MSRASSGKRLVRLVGPRDITRRQEAEAALRESEERFRAMFEQAAVGITVVAPDGRFLRVNQRLCDMVGYSAGELLLLRFRDITHPDDVETNLAHRRPMMVGTVRAYSIEKRYVHKDGSILWVHVTASQVRDVPGESGSSIGIVQDITARKRLETERRRAAERLQTLSRRLLHVQEEERRGLARELHDEVGQELTALKINLQMLRRGQDDPVRAARLDDGIEITDRLLEQVRGLALDLRPSMLDDLGLGPAVRWYVERQAWRAPFAAEIDIDIELGGERLPHDVETACFRIVQEAVTNAVRHAAPRRVRVTMHEAEGKVTVRVLNDGRTFDVEAARQRAVAGGSLGLLGMEERASLLGGDFHVESGPDETVVRAVIPVRRPVP